MLILVFEGAADLAQAEEEQALFLCRELGGEYGFQMIEAGVRTGFGARHRPIVLRNPAVRGDVADADFGVAGADIVVLVRRSRATAQREQPGGAHTSAPHACPAAEGDASADCSEDRDKFSRTNCMCSRST